MPSGALSGTPDIQSKIRQLIQMKKTKWLSRELFRGPFLCLCLTQKELDKALKHCGAKAETITEQGRCTTLQKKNKLVCIVSLNNFVGRGLTEVVGIIAHEAAHVWQETKELIGEDKPSPEFEAYAIQNLTQTLLEDFLKRVTVKKFKIVALR